jgi:hypothetical protein
VLRAPADLALKVGVLGGGQAVGVPGHRRYSATTRSATSAHISQGTGHLLGMGQAASASRVGSGAGATVKDSLTVRPCSLVAGAVAMRAKACWVGVVKLVIAGQR